jgi:hypothetical protein
VISCLQEIDPFLTHLVDKPVLLSDTPRPGSSERVTKSLRLADAQNWVPHDSFDEFENP